MTGERIIYSLTSPEIPRPYFWIVRVLQELPVGKDVNFASINMEPIYWGDGKLGSYLFGLATMTAITRSGGSSAILHHPDDKFCISDGGLTVWPAASDKKLFSVE